MNIKNVLPSVLLTTLVSCAPPPTYAKRDYNQYPDYKNEIALYNLQEIAKNICSGDGGLPRCNSMTFTPDQMTYVETDCVELAFDAPSEVEKYCKRTKEYTFEIKWDEIKKMIPSYFFLKICIDEHKCPEIYRFRNYQQTYEFAEAIEILRKSKK
ncbi:hypothetical protein A2642_03385 [Candidatus Nomurabacteria bacterium RIFCSPHIGHO2_01_FULL_39_10]|uniref:Uncharacterized protein n=1 Tax=Candidatus Nomurabacteria bacterium RIFCSPHIGHO2_01_FULL_39_10 TaxID=1801733 RepID=A0A1F6V456_9BACT|nr:MAG: hypothetical protein A2642_03385 [Candidatus Nomurabacteria bacterium RIFCSPHIGHO2_01_FULL_39_10]